jgi:hypothetical protein
VSERRKPKKEPEVASGRDPRERKAILEALESMSIYRLRTLMSEDLGMDARAIKEIELKGKTAMVTAIITMYDEGHDLPGLLVGSRPAKHQGEDEEQEDMAKKTPVKDPFDDGDDESTGTSSDNGPEDDQDGGDDSVENEEAPPPTKTKSKKSPAKDETNSDGESTSVEAKIDKIMNILTGMDNVLTDVGSGFISVQEKVESLHSMVVELRTKALVAIDVLYRMGHQIWKVGTTKPMLGKDGKPQAFKTLYEDAVLRVADQLKEKGDE